MEGKREEDGERKREKEIERERERESWSGANRNNNVCYKVCTRRLQSCLQGFYNVFYWIRRVCGCREINWNSFPWS